MQSENGRFLFIRTGWMKKYIGSTLSDPKPIGGGKYNKMNIGGEVDNFINYKDGNRYIYFQPSMKSDKINLSRICKHNTNKEFIDGVTVIICAPSPDNNDLVIVGFCKNACVYRDPQKKTDKYNKQFRIKCNSKDSLLINHRNRNFTIPKKLGGFGQTNICYYLDDKGERKGFDWMENAIQYVYSANDKSNMYSVVNSSDISDAAIKKELFEQLYANPDDRRKIEDYAMTQALDWLEKNGFYEIEDVSRKKNYACDFICKKHEMTYLIEVKGTRSEGNYIILTNNEFDKSNNNSENYVLIVVESIVIAGGFVVGGNVVCYSPFRANQCSPKPTHYVCRLKAK